MPYITPDNTPTNYKCWRVLIPDDLYCRLAFLGQMSELYQSWNWEQFDGISASEVAQLFQVSYDSIEQGCNMLLGCLINYVTDTPPANVLPCDGTQYLRVDYPDLYAVLPLSLIIDADNFITPTIQDKFVLAAGVTYIPEDTGGEETHTLTTDELPAHSHNYDHATLTLDIKSAGSPDISSYGLPDTATPTSSVGNDNPHNNMPPFVAYKIGIIAK